MMGYRLAPAAQADLDDIWQYTVSSWRAAQAERYTRAIRDAAEDLARGNRQGQAIDEVRAGYRKLAVGSHLLFCRSARDDDGIEIIRILHQRMDVSARLGDAGGERQT
jgi:toxin ParE1/3/4